MITLSEIYVAFRETVSPDRLDQFAIALEETSENLARELFGRAYDDFSITVSVRVETGSTKTWIRILAVLAFIERYGAIRDGANQIAHDIRNIATTIGITAPHVVELGNPARVQVRPGVPERLHRVFQDVSSGRLTTDEATSVAIRLLEDATPDERETAERLRAIITREIARVAAAAADRKPLPSHETTTKQVPEGQRPRRDQRRKRPVSAPPARPSRQRRPRPRGVIVTRDRVTGRLGFSRY